MYLYNYMSTYTIVYLQLYEYLYNHNRLHLIKICLCCFLDIHLYSNNLSIIATNSPSIKVELLPPCFSCNNNFNLSHNSFGSDDGLLFLRYQKP